MSKNFSDMKINLIKKGDLVTGEIISTSTDEGKEFWVLNINGKSEVYIPKVEDLKIGDFIDVVIETPCDNRGRTIVSLEKALTYKFYNQIKENLKTIPNKLYNVKVTKRTANGYLVNFQLDILGILPYTKTNSQNLKIGDIVDVSILNIDKNNNIEVFIPGIIPNDIKVGDIIKCTVKSITDNCYYLSTAKGNKDFKLNIFDVPKNTTYKVGDIIDVCVSKKTDGRIHVSVNAILEQKINSSFEKKKFYPAVVTKINENSLDVELEHGVKAILNKGFSKGLLKGETEGLIGKTFYVKIFKIIGSLVLLSMHTDENITLKNGDIVEGIIIDKNISLGLLIVRYLGMEIVINKFNCHYNYKDSEEIFNKIPLWSLVKIEITNVDLEKSRIYGIFSGINKERKHLLSLDDSYNCSVKKIFNTGILVSFTNDKIDFSLNGFIPKNELVDSSRIKIDDILVCKIIKKDNDSFLLSPKSFQESENFKALSSFSAFSEDNISDLFGKS